MHLPAIFGARHFSDYALLGRLTPVLEELGLRGETRLPSESELCRRLDVDRYQLHRLLQTLARDGLVYQVRAKGWFLQPDKLDITVSRHNSYTSAMVRQNRVPRSEILGIDQAVVEDGGFWDTAGTWNWVLDFRRYVGPLAFSLARIQLPVDRTPGLNRHLGNDVSLYRVLQEQYGIRPDRQRTWCEAVPADLIVADALAVPVSSPLLRITHEALWGGRPFEHTVNYLRADACRVRFDLVGPTEEPR